MSVISPKHKERLELDAMKEIFGTLDGETSAHLLDVWNRYEEQKEI